MLIPALALAACAETPDQNAAARRSLNAMELPPIKTFSRFEPSGILGSNAELARDFLELSFSLETGTQLPVLTRFEGPITVRMKGTFPSAIVERDLQALLGRMRSEAGVPISSVSSDVDASITVQTVPTRQMRAVASDAACFVVPNVSDWEEFRRLRNSRSVNWAGLKTRTKVAVFMPVDVGLQEMRDCLHEEIAQAVGPLNDLYRLPNSVFNDDNFHTVLTNFDMMMLRVTYSPLLKSGMTKAEVTNLLPRILRALNPSGGSATVLAPVDTPRAWVRAIETARDGRASATKRLQASERAIRIATLMDWSDNRFAYSLFTAARLTEFVERDIAKAAFEKVSRVYGSRRQTQLQYAHVDARLARFALEDGQAEQAIVLIDKHLNVARAAQNAELLSTLLLLKAQAQSDLGMADASVQTKQDGLAWAQYGFDGEAEISDRLADIQALSPLT